MMGHLGDVLHALLTADAVLTYATQWFSFPAFCFSLVAHSCHSTYGSENPTEGTSKVREHQIEGTHKVGKIRIEGNMIFFVVPTRGTPLLKGVDLEILKLLQLRYLRISQKSLYPVGTDGKNGGEAGRLADSYAVVNGRLWSHATSGSIPPVPPPNCQIRTWRFVENTFRETKYFLQTKVCQVRVTVDLNFLSCHYFQC